MVDIGVDSQDPGQGTLSGIGIVNGNQGARVLGGDMAGINAMSGPSTGFFARLNSYAGFNPRGLASSSGRFWAFQESSGAGV